MNNESETTLEESEIDLTEVDLTQPVEERVVASPAPDTQHGSEETPLFPEDMEATEVEIDLEEEDLTLPLDEGPLKSSFLNLAFFDVTRPSKPETLKIREGFLSGRTYRLAIALSPQQDERYTSIERQPPLIRPDDESEVLKLLVTVRLEGEALRLLGPRMDTIEWPRGAFSTKSAEFVLQAATVYDLMRVPLHIVIYYNNNRLFSATLSILIAPAGHSWEKPHGISWR